MALGELIPYILDEENENTGMVFKLSDLIKLYIQTWERLGDHIDYKINRPHLKNRLLQSPNDLHAYNEGRNVFITFKVDVGKSLQKKYLEKSDDWMHMARAAVTLRKSILSHETEFTGEFNSNCQRSSVPRTLRNFIYLVLMGKKRVRMLLNRKISSFDFSIDSVQL